MKLINFKEWLQNKSLNENPVQMSNTLTTGQTKPSPELTQIANNMISQANPNLFNSVKGAPSQDMAQKRLMNAVQADYKKLNPAIQKQYPLGDIASTVSTSMGFKDFLRDKTV